MADHPNQPLHPCPACGYAVFAGAYGSQEACLVCGWIDDYFQLTHPDFILGANSGISLREAQAAVPGANPAAANVSGTFLKDSRWRPLASGETPCIGAAGLASPVCYLDTFEAEAAEDFEAYWLGPPLIDAN